MLFNNKKTEMYKIKYILIALVVIFSSRILSAQDNYRPWLIGAGVSTVDMRVPTDFTGMVKDWFGYPDMNVGFRLAASRYLRKGITTEVGFAYASITRDENYFRGEASTKVTGKSFFGADVRARYHLNRLWEGLPWLDPYPQLGLGISSIEGKTKVNFIAGVGANFWFTDVIGANVQTSYHPSLKGGIGSDYFQLGVGVVVKFPFKALEEPIVDHVERERLPKIKKERKRITKARPITRVETPEEREARTIRVTKEINLYAKTILFDLDKAIVKTQAEFILDNIAKIMQENEDFNFVIEGHTDNTGTPEHNLQLSQERADAIRAYLVNKGINKKRLEAKGYGLSRPLESNDTERGREINRRVEINVIPDEQHVEKTL